VANVLPLESAPHYLGRAEADLVIFLLSPALERSLAVLGEVRGQTRARVLALGPATDPKLILRSLRNGADEYLDEADLDAELEGGLRRGQGGTAAPGRLLALLAPSGGSGSSTLAVNVATVLARSQGRSLLLDLNLECGDLATLLDLKPAHDLAELCHNAEQLDRTMFERSLAAHVGGAHLLAAPRTLGDVGLVTPDGLRRVLVLARALFPFLVADLDHTFREELAEVLRQADAVLLVLRLDFTCLRNAKKALDYLGQLSVPADRIRLVVNRLGQAKEVPAARAEQALGLKVFHAVPDDPKTVNRANNNGVPAVLDNPGARVCRSLTRLAQTVAAPEPARAS
jgi:pilus assembly protein CpaE